MNTLSIEGRPRVMLADDYQPLLVAWRRFLDPWCEVVGSVSTGREVLEVARQCLPDVLVLDLNMPGLNGLEVCREIRKAMPQVGVVLASAANDADLRRAAFQVGVSAFVPKYLAVRELESAIRRASRGHASFQPSTTREHERNWGGVTTSLVNVRKVSGGWSQRRSSIRRLRAGRSHV